jgi:DNA repair protein SbcD/Mre11
MATFLHLGDIHLGYRQYKLLEREKDFFKAFLDICQRHAIERKVDFVLVAGDLFNTRTISPQSFNEALYVLGKLKSAGIPVIAIEGNHDFKESGNYISAKGSWYEALAQSGLIYFLYPAYQDGQIVLEPLELNKKYLGGGYLDIQTDVGVVRIVGSRWQGFNAGAALPSFAKAIAGLPSKAHYTIFMFHAGHENYLPVSRGGVSGVDFEELKDVVDYVALGHIHESYIIKNNASCDFLFNPGSTEANSMAEAGILRGGFLVELKTNKETSVTLVQDYYQRPFYKLETLQASDYTAHDFLTQAAFNLAQENLKKTACSLPVLQVNITGNPAFDRSLEGLNNLKQQIEDEGALYCQVRWDQEERDFEDLEESNETINRLDLERKILLEIMQNDPSIAEPQTFTEMMLRVKNLISANGSEPAELLAEINSFEQKTYCNQPHSIMPS